MSLFKNLDLFHTHIKYPLINTRMHNCKDTTSIQPVIKKYFTNTTDTKLCRKFTFTIYSQTITRYLD